MKVRNTGKYGIIRDMEAWELPPEAWSDGMNVRMQDGAVEKFLGSSSTALGTPTVAPMFLLPHRDSSSFFWIYAGTGDVYVTDGMTHKKITKSGTTYFAIEDKNWTGLVFGGIPILNNGVDAPQQWSPVDFAVPQLLTDLSNWPANTVCGALRGHKNFLIAMNVTKSGIANPRMVKWSHAAGANAVPTSWDETDATKDAGEFELQDTPGEILDGASDGPLFMVYKDDSIWNMQFIGAPLIWRFDKTSDQIGALTRRCIARTKVGHIVFGTDDVVLVRGNSVASVIDRRARRTLYNSIDSSNYERSFVAHNIAKSEVWLCYPQTGATRPDKAMVYNYSDGTVSERDLPDVSHIEFGVADPAAADDTFDSGSSGSFDTETFVFDELLFSTAKRNMIGASLANTKLYLFDDTNQEDGANMTSFIERSGIGGEDMPVVKSINELFLQMESSGPVNVEVGTQMSSKEAILWRDAVSFNPSTDKKVDVRATGILFALRVGSTTDVNWSLSGYNFPFNFHGRR